MVDLAGMLASCPSGTFVRREIRSPKARLTQLANVEEGWVSVNGVGEVSFLFRNISGFWLHDEGGIRQVSPVKQPWWRRWLRMPAIKGVKAQWWRLSNPAEVLAYLEQVEACLHSTQHRVGVLGLLSGQSSEAAAFGNDHAELELAVAQVASKIELSGWTGFRGGLDLTGSSGNHAYYHRHGEDEFIFHVASLMPANGNERKRHIGNDLVVWVHVAEACLDLDTVQSRQNQVFIVDDGQRREVWARQGCGEIQCQGDGDLFELGKRRPFNFG